MGIWIRSQDKSLYCCIGINSPVQKDYAKDKNKPWTVIGVVAAECEPFLGWYETEKRALQIVDEINRAIGQIRLAELGVRIIVEVEREYPNFTFQMPTE